MYLERYLEAREQIAELTTMLRDVLTFLTDYSTWEAQSPNFDMRNLFIAYSLVNGNGDLCRVIDWWNAVRMLDKAEGSEQEQRAVGLAKLTDKEKQLFGLEDA